MRAEPTTAVHTASTTGSDPQASARSATPMPTSFDALSEEPTPLKRMCSLESSCVHGERKKTNEDGGWGHVNKKTLGVMRKPLDEHVFVLTHCIVHLLQRTCEQCGASLCCPRSHPETTFAFFMVIQTRKNPLEPRPCEAVPQGSGFSTRPTSTSHTGFSRIQGMRAR